MRQQTIELPVNLMATLSDNPKLRNQVAYAHKHFDSNGNFKYFATCSYPTKYIVTPEQIESAKAILKSQKENTIKNIGNKLIFVGMGMNYEERYNGDPANHRIRTEILAPDGNQYFIEVGTAKGNDMRIDFSILRIKKEKSEDVYNYRLQQGSTTIKYTLQNILNLVNRTYGCHFTEIDVDRYTLNTSDYISTSPKK